MHAGDGSHSFHSHEVKEICSSFHFRQCVQLRQVCLPFSAKHSLDNNFSPHDGSFSFLWGPWEHMRHLFSRDRLPFTAVYVGTIIATLYCSLGVSDTAQFLSGFWQCM